MKHFDSLKMVLFDSTNANFRIAVEAQFSRRNPDMTYRDLVYTTERFSGILNPNIYLTFAYKGDDISPVYTSYPQLYPIRHALKKMVDDYESGKVFVKNDDGSLFVNNNYSEKTVISEIGKNNNWFCLGFEIIKSGENGVVTYSPGVSIELSTNNGYTSLLSIEEFLTVYTIINDINLSSIQSMMSIAYLTADPRPVYTPYPPQPYYPQPAAPQAQPYAAPQYNRAPQAAPVYPQQRPAAPQAPQMAQDSTPYARPLYNNNYNAPKAPYRSTQTPPPPTATAEQPRASQPQGETLPPRQQINSSPIVNLKSVEETPVAEYSYDDVEALNDIFNEDNKE